MQRTEKRVTLVPRAGWVLRLYRGIHSVLIGPLVSRKRHSRQSRLGGLVSEWASVSGPTIWIHAASLGELESLWTVALELGRRKFCLALTVFSPSGLGGLGRLVLALKAERIPICFAGLSPWEGEWEEALVRANPQLFLTTKYEAWPDLWASLSRLKIALSIACAKPRRSLALAQQALGVFGLSLPKMIFFSESEKDRVLLHQRFPLAEVLSAGEPRWDRVRSRMATLAPRVAELVERFKVTPRPWGTIGSAWLSDLRVLDPILQEMKGSLFVVPHHLGRDNLAAIRRFLLQYFDEVILTSEPAKAGQYRGRTCIVLDEMGLLLEFYKYSDWVFVGGGFERGVHSTIEPALYGLPLFCGPKKSDLFSEIGQLQKLGQLQVIRTPDDALAAFQKIQSVSEEKRREWRAAVSECEGATGILVQRIEKIFDSSRG